MSDTTHLDAVTWFTTYLAVQDAAERLYEKANEEYVAEHGDWEGDAPDLLTQTVQELAKDHPQEALLSAYWTAQGTYAAMMTSLADECDATQVNTLLGHDQPPPPLTDLATVIPFGTRR